ncbi:hypothetical protein BG011_008062, partial [Mortierella polycephala]
CMVQLSVSVNQPGSSMPVRGTQGTDVRHYDHRERSRPSPFSIPELVQEICSYLDRPTLVRGCRVSRQFQACCGQLLWMNIPGHAWANKFFRDNWHIHGSRIRSLCCGPGVDLGRISLYCRNLVSLDVSHIRDSTDVNNMDTVSHMNARAVIQDRVGCTTSAMNNKPNSGHDKAGPIPLRKTMDSYSSFVRMAENLERIIRSNKHIKCLQIKPQGQLPRSLIETFSQHDQLRMLSLNGWQNFHEYSLLLIIESCPRLTHLSLGENDFTQYTLEALASSSSTPISHTKPDTLFLNIPEGKVRLERCDDPIKGRNGSKSADQDLLEIHSKRAVLYHHKNQDQQDQRVQSRIQSLSLHQSGLRQDFLVNLTKACPRLEHLSLLDGWGFYPSSRFAFILSQACPHLSRFEFREQSLDLQDEFFVSLCTNFPQLQWIHAGRTGFSHGALESVRMNCREIVSLNLDGARGIQSGEVDQILQTCASLKVFSAQGVVLNGWDLKHGSTWACRGLETLVLDIEIYAPIDSSTMSSCSVTSVRERVYDQLAQLTRLVMLGLGGGHSVRGVESGVDLTLASGLERLASLHCLECLDIRRLRRVLGQEDMAWMVQHWPRFQKLEINKSRTYNHRGDMTNKAIEWLVKARPGMDIRLY